MSEADIEPEPAGPAPSLFWVAACLVRRAFGGREDGGWFFDERTLVTDPAVYQRLNGAPAAFLSESEAEAHAGRLRVHLPRLNAGRRPLGSVLSDGLYDVEVIEAATLPPVWPQTRPRYA